MTLQEVLPLVRRPVRRCSDVDENTVRTLPVHQAKKTLRRSLQGCVRPLPLEALKQVIHPRHELFRELYRQKYGMKPAYELSATVDIFDRHMITILQTSASSCLEDVSLREGALPMESKDYHPFSLLVLGIPWSRVPSIGEDKIAGIAWIWRT